MDGFSQEKNLRPYAELFFTGEGSANVQKILIAENALGYKLADRHHGKTGLRDRRKGDVSEETTYPRGRALLDQLDVGLVLP